MSVNERLAALEGRWSGTNRLNLGPESGPVRESESTAEVRIRVNGQCLEIEYSWSYEGRSQVGVILISGARDTDNVEAFWTDSWHSAHTIMPCRGNVDKNGRLNVFGQYKVTGHPDWGWRTEILPTDEGFRYVMYNVSPENEELWAVDTEFKREK